MMQDVRQPGKRRFRLAVGLCCAILATLLVSTGLELRREFASAGALRAAVERSYATRLQIQSLFSLLQDAETGQRGYIITGNDQFLEPYRSALTALDGQLAALGRLFEGEAQQSADHRRLAGMIARKRATMEQSIALRASGQTEAAIAAVSSGQGKAAMDDIRRVVDRMTRYEAQHLADLSRNAASRTHQAEMLVVLLFLALVGTAAATSGLVWRYLHTRGALLEQLQAAAARQRATLDSAFDAIITLNPSGSIETMNPAAERMFGWQFEEVERRDVSLLIDVALNGDGSFLERLGASQGAFEEGVLRELLGRRKDGETFAADVAIGPMDLPTGRHLVAVVRDITERRRVAEMKDAFVSTVSHELRTPLTSIAGSLGLLSGGACGPLPEKASRLIGIAHSNSQRLVRLINDILDVEKLASGGLVLSLATVDLRDIAWRAIEGVRGFAEPMNVRLNLAGDEGVLVRGDADRLIQVATNLLSNAAKFSPAGGSVAVTVGVHNRVARISVADSGPGIPDDFRSRIFGKFAQADSTDARAKSGTGLGLAIAREIAERHGGRLWYDSVVGQGATFHLDLPLDPSLRDARSGPSRLLICEDDADLAVVLAEMLATEGYQADVAGTAREALALARKGGYAAALVDLQLPDADGVGLIRTLKASAATRTLPVIVVSGDIANGQARGRSLEVADWMEKPVDQARLRNAVQALFMAHRKPLVLHVDDDRDILEVTREALDGVDVISAESLVQAREALERQRPDLVILDLGLPDGQGLDLLPQLTDEEGRTIPVVIYSAQELDHRAAPAVEAVLTKSRMSLSQLARTVRHLTHSGGGPS